MNISQLRHARDKARQHLNRCIEGQNRSSFYYGGDGAVTKAREEFKKAEQAVWRAEAKQQKR
jgi:hypothetical protein